MKLNILTINHEDAFLSSDFVARENHHGYCERISRNFKVESSRILSNGMSFTLHTSFSGSSCYKFRVLQ